MREYHRTPTPNAKLAIIARSATFKLISRWGERTDFIKPVHKPVMRGRGSPAGRLPMRSPAPDARHARSPGALPPKSFSSTVRCSRCSSFRSMSQFMWAGPHVFLPGQCRPIRSMRRRLVTSSAFSRSRPATRSRRFTLDRNPMLVIIAVAQSCRPAVFVGNLSRAGPKYVFEAALR